MTTQKKFLLIDGHSVIFQWPELRRLHSQNPSKCRAALTALLGTLHDTSNWLVTLVFDGKTGPNEPARPGTMAVIYSQEGQTADSIIERLVGQANDPSLVYVVTADEAERITVEAAGAFVYSPDWLAGEIEQNTGQWQQALKDVHKKAKW